jgi:hypothetical protein
MKQRRAGRTSRLEDLMTYRVRWLVFVLVVATASVAVTDDEGMPEMSAQEMAMMEAWMKAGTPGPHHANLAKLEGAWDLEVKWWMPGRDEPVVSKATSRTQMVLGGRFLHEMVEGEGLDGGSFEGAGLTGYDNSQQRYVAMWADTMSTALMTSAGHCNEEFTACTYFTESWDPAERTLTVGKSVERVRGPDTRVVKFYETAPDGSERLSMEITYTRKKTGD